MKLNSDSSKGNVCKEEVLTCLFKEVPNFMADDEKDGVDVEENWVSHGHQEFIIGKQGLPKHVPVTSSIEQADLTKIWEEKGSPTTNPASKLKKCKRSSTVLEGITELELRSSPFISQLRNAIMSNTPLNNICIKYIPDSLEKNVESKLKTDELCDACQLEENNSEESWLSLSEDESDDELMRKWVQASKKQLGGKQKQSRLSCTHSFKNIPIQNYTEKEVMKLLSNVQAHLLQCSVQLMSFKLHNKECKARATDKETPSDMLLDQMKESFDQIVEDGIKDGSSKSKQYLALGRLVYKCFKALHNCAVHKNEKLTF